MKTPEGATYIWHRFSDKPECNWGKSEECKGSLTCLLDENINYYSFVCDFHRGNLADRGVDYGVHPEYWKRWKVYSSETDDLNPADLKERRNNAL